MQFNCSMFSVPTFRCNAEILLFPFYQKNIITFYREITVIVAIIIYSTFFCGIGAGDIIEVKPFVVQSVFADFRIFLCRDFHQYIAIFSQYSIDGVHVIATIYGALTIVVRVSADITTEFFVVASKDVLAALSAFFYNHR